MIPRAIAAVCPTGFLEADDPSSREKKKKPNLGLVFKNHASPRIQARGKNQNTMQGGSGSTWCWSWSSVCTPEKESTILAFVGGTKWIAITQIKPTMERLKQKQISPLNQSAGEALFRKRNSWTRKMENWKEAQNWGRKHEDDVKWNWRKENFHLRLPVPHSLTWHWQAQRQEKAKIDSDLHEPRSLYKTIPHLELPCIQFVKST